MNSRFLVFLATTIGFLVVSFPTFAHHGNAAYDEKNPVTLKGTVTEFVWANPHTQIYFDVKNDKGNVEHWACESLSPGKLVRAGWTKDAVKPGEEITITLSPAKNGVPIGFLHKLLLADGKALGIDELPQ
jgi:uncharacterized protein DUF6152